MSQHDDSVHDEDPGLLIRELTELTRKKRRLAGMGGAMGAFVALAILATLIAVFVLKMKAPWAGFLSIGSVLASRLARRAVASDYDHALAQSLQKWGDVRAVGPLAQALSIRRIDKAIVTDALTTLLPKLKPSDASLLDRDQRSALFAALKLSPEIYAEFLIALLGGLAQLGDPEALPHVEALMKRLPDTPEEQRVFEAAHVCREVLLEAARLEQEKQTLLRPAAQADSTDNLLRPVASASQTDEAILLRPHSQEDAS